MIYYIGNKKHSFEIYAKQDFSGLTKLSPHFENMKLNLFYYNDVLRLF